MRSFILSKLPIVALCGILALKVDAAPEALFGRYTIVDLTFAVPAPNGSTIYVNGTVEDVARTLEAIDPSFVVPNVTADTDKPASAIARRRRQFPNLLHDVKCGFFSNAKRFAINNGISHLRATPGKPSAHPGPNSCGRVSCSYNSGIYWCNDDPDSSKTLDSFGMIADAAQNIMNECAVLSDVAGQDFFEDPTEDLSECPDGYARGWNIIVHGDRC